MRNVILTIVAMVAFSGVVIADDHISVSNNVNVSSNVNVNVNSNCTSSAAHYGIGIGNNTSHNILPALQFPESQIRMICDNGKGHVIFHLQNGEIINSTRTGKDKWRCMDLQ